MTDGRENKDLQGPMASDRGETAAGPDFSITPNVSAAYATNADQAPHGGIATSYVSPGVAFDYKVPQLAGWAFKATVSLSADYMARDPEDLNGSRASVTLRLTRPTPLGDLSFGFKSKSSFAGTFGEHAYTDARASVGFAPEFGKVVGLTLVAEYRTANTAEQRRGLLMAFLVRDWELSKSWTFELSETAKYSHYVAGANLGRDDLFSETAATLAFSRGRYEIDLTAALNASASNRAANRFTDLEVGPSVKARF